MKILLTGATGYLAQRLLPLLLHEGHEVTCCVREVNRFNRSGFHGKFRLVEVDFLDSSTLDRIPGDIDVAFYLIHSMATYQGDFTKMEELCARNFIEGVSTSNIRQVIYLSGITNDLQLSKHLDSRKKVGEILATGNYALTILRAGIIVGSGSASFEIIRDLVEKLPVMIAPRWLNTPTQPVAIRNVLEFLIGVAGNERTFNQSFDIGGPDVLSYREMLLKFAKVRKLRRKILVVPVMTPTISSYWLYFVTSTSFPLAKNLVNSMKVEVVCKPNDLADMLNIELIGYEQSIQMAFDKIEQNQVMSSWKDAQSSGLLKGSLSVYVQVPRNGCFRDVRKVPVNNPEETIDRIWRIGGKTGWYFGNWLWEIRGFLDQLAGGVGMRRGRRSESELRPGDALDFWRVILADKSGGRLLLFAEMKLPGEAWLEFRIEHGRTLVQEATFRPRGVCSRLYWYAVLPFHGMIFSGMLRNIAR